MGIAYRDDVMMCFDVRFAFSSLTCLKYDLDAGGDAHHTSKITQP